MITFDLDTENSILHMQPESAIARDDFVKLAAAVDPHIEASGDLAGLVIKAAGFPGWEGFGAFVNHVRFVRDHHKHVKKIAVVTDSHLGTLPNAWHHILSRRRFGNSRQGRRRWLGNGS